MMTRVVGGVVLFVGLAACSGSSSEIANASSTSPSSIGSAPTSITVAVTAAARYTAAGFALVFGHTIVGALSVSRLFRWFRPWDLVENAYAFANGGDAARWEFATQHQEWIDVFNHGPALALFYVAAYVTVIVWVAAVVFSRRDIT